MRLAVGNFLMRFIEDTRAHLGAISWRAFSRLIGMDHQKLLYYMDEKHAGKMREFIQFICRLRKLSKKSWSAFGKELDAEFLDGETK